MSYQKGWWYWLSNNWSVTHLIVPTGDKENVGFLFFQESFQTSRASCDGSYSCAYSSSLLELSGSEYNPHTVCISERKKVSQKGKCDDLAKCKAQKCEFHGRNVISVLFACHLFAKNNWSRYWYVLCFFIVLKVAVNHQRYRQKSEVMLMGRGAFGKGNHSHLPSAAMQADTAVPPA